MASSIFPQPKFHFSVEWGGSKVGFQEVSGLDIEYEVLEYREGSSPEYSKLNMPGMKKYTDITLKRGVFAADNELFDWFNSTLMNVPERRDITISLLNEGHEPVVVWKVKDAWPMKLQSTDLKGEENAIAIETLVLKHGGLTIQND